MAESDTSKLIDMALLALFEMSEEAASEPYPRSRGLRFLLAFLHSQSRGDLRPFKEYWHNAVRPEGNRMPEIDARNRQIGMDNALLRICHQLGYEREVLRKKYRRQEEAWRAKKRPDWNPNGGGRPPLSSGRSQPTSTTSQLRPWIPDVR